MRLNILHNENIKTFDNLSRHLKLEAEHLEAAKANGSSYTAQSGHLGRNIRKTKTKIMKILDLRLRRLILSNAREASVLVRRAKLAQHALIVARKNTSLVIALS